MKIKLTQEQADTLVTKMLVQDYKRMAKRLDDTENVKLLEAFQVLLGEYYLSADEFFELQSELCNKIVFVKAE